MRRPFDFLKTCAAGGLFVLLPLLLMWLLLDEMLGLIVAMATPIADMFPAGTFDDLTFPVPVALLLILAASFLFGLALQSSRLRGLGRWIEGNTLQHLPMYGALKRLSLGFSVAQQDRGFRSALLSSAGGTSELVYLVEDLGDGRAAILVPWAPASFAGSVKIVPTERLQVLSASLGDASLVLGYWGVGMSKLLAAEPGSEQAAAGSS